MIFAIAKNLQKNLKKQINFFLKKNLILFYDVGLLESCRISIACIHFNAINSNCLFAFEKNQSGGQCEDNAQNSQHNLCCQQTFVRFQRWVLRILILPIFGSKIFHFLGSEENKNWKNKNWIRKWEEWRLVQCWYI